MPMAGKTFFHLDRICPSGFRRLLVRKHYVQQETRTRFIEFRGQGWTIKRIANPLQVAPRTLVEWNRQDNQQIRTLRVLELEALQEKILATREQELQSAGNKTAPFLPRFCLN